MSASLISSFLMFIVVGIYTFKTGITESSWLTSIEDKTVRNLIFLCISANAIYFYYCAARVESQTKMHNILQKCNSAEWLIRVCNQLMMLSFWIFIVQSKSLFTLYFMCLHLTFIIWDLTIKYQLLSRDRKTDIFDGMSKTDLAGFGLTLLFVAYINNSSFLALSAGGGFALGLFFFGYMLITVVGIYLGYKDGFNPLSYIYRGIKGDKKLLT